MKPPESITIEAPAKINLGLEILGKRPDGYHEVRTVMAIVGLTDTLTVVVGEGNESGTISGVPDENNLIVRALDAFRSAVPGCPQLGWTIEKRIPVAAGLGGASSNAAASLIAANELSGRPLDPLGLGQLAESLGSDIPFFLGSPAALASGRGTHLKSLPPIESGVLLVVPDVKISHKTKTLYSLLDRPDFTDGSRIDAIATLISNHRVPGAKLLGNAFARALGNLVPGIRQLRETLEEISSNPVALSGAGPAHYVLLGGSDASIVQERLAESFGDWVSVIHTQTLLRSPLQIEPVTSG
jgi:4-diphosphocytidyl-2-C-methyl-D-erythritol kinase